MNESLLIGRAEKFLSQIHGFDGKVGDVHSFLGTYSQFKDNRAAFTNSGIIWSLRVTKPPSDP